jgi:competence protein ComEA
VGSDRSAEPPDDAPRKPLLRRADQFTAATVLLIALLVMLGLWIYRGGPRGGLIEIDRTPREHVDFKIDVNDADWPEFALLPGVGKTIAQRIVASREAEGPFHRHEDLLRVKGIGVKTYARIQPHLLPIEAPQAAE